MIILSQGTSNVHYNFLLFSFTYKVSRNADTYELPSLACKNFYKMAKMNDQLMNISKMCPKSKVEADQDGNYKMITSPDKFQCYQKIWKRALTMDNMEYVSIFFFQSWGLATLEITRSILSQSEPSCS